VVTPDSVVLDVVVTETLSAFGFEERILSSVIDARTRLLRPGATIIPRRVEIYAVPVELPVVFDRHVSWWQQKPYGFDLSPLSVFASNVIYVSNVKPEWTPERRWTSSWKARMERHGGGAA
jgi:hypothetical protein